MKTKFKIYEPVEDWASTQSAFTSDMAEKNKELTNRINRNFGDLPADEIVGITPESFAIEVYENVDGMECEDALDLLDEFNSFLEKLDIEKHVGVWDDKCFEMPCFYIPKAKVSEIFEIVNF